MYRRTLQKLYQAIKQTILSNLISLHTITLNQARKQSGFVSLQQTNHFGEFLVFCVLGINPPGPNLTKIDTQNLLQTPRIATQKVVILDPHTAVALVG